MKDKEEIKVLVINAFRSEERRGIIYSITDKRI